MPPSCLRQSHWSGVLSVYLLDTNHCSQIIGANPNVIKKLQEISSQGVGISAITRGELIFMVEKSERVKENYDKFSPFLDNINTYLIDNDISDCYGKLKAKILKHFGPKDKKQARNTTVQKLGFSDNDLWISCHGDKLLMRGSRANCRDWWRMRSGSGRGGRSHSSTLAQ